MLSYLTAFNIYTEQYNTLIGANMSVLRHAMCRVL